MVAASTTASAKISLNLSYTLSQDEPDGVLGENANVGYTNLTFGNGTGLGEINLGIKSTGFLPAGGDITFDIAAMPKEIFYGSITGNFINIKGLILTNTQTVPSFGATAQSLPYFTIRATGTNAFTNLFNGGSGNVNVTPQSTWSHTNLLGTAVTSTNRYFSLLDSGSGVPYELAIVGVTGSS